MPSALVNGITTPMFVVQNISLVLTTWYLARLFQFVSKGKREKPWTWGLLISMTCLNVFNTIAICYSNAVLFVDYSGRSARLWALPFYLKTGIIVNSFTTISFQSAYTIFIVRLWPQIGPRWLKFVVIPIMTAAIVAALGIFIRLHVMIASADSYLDTEILDHFQEIMDLSAASPAVNLVIDLAITCAMARLLLRSRNGTGKAFRFLKTMSLFVGACGALNTSISVLLIIISQVFSSYSFWKLVLLPVPSLVGAISFLSLLNNRASWDTRPVSAGKDQGSIMQTVVAGSGAGASLSSL